MKIKKKNTTIPISGKIVDTENVEDKTSNAPSLRLVEEMVKDIYSTEEVRIGTWLGKPLYRKVFKNLTDLPNNKTLTVRLGILARNIQVHKVEAFAIHKEQFNLIIPLPSYGSYPMGFNISSTNDEIIAAFNTTNDRTNYTADVIIEYTKTTD